jgi:SAM-dependent methyltransferase
MSNFTWEEIIIQIRNKPEFRELVELAYFEEDLVLNVERFKKSEEYAATLKILRETYTEGGTIRLADIGAGNGVASAAFALDGFRVTAIEPDSSLTIGAGAITNLKRQLNLANLDILKAFGESLPLESGSFDIVYVRQALHHAAKLNEFMKEATRILRSGGIMLSVRDHVVYNEKDKKWFLDTHPLHRFYGGENAFTEQEYRNAILGAGLIILNCMHHYDSVINYFPESTKIIEDKKKLRHDNIAKSFKNKFPGLMCRIPGIKKWYFKRAESKLEPLLDERKIPGRHISFLLKKPL